MSTVKDFAGNYLTDTVKIYVGGTLQTHTTNWTIDATTGIVTFTGAHIPGGGTTITADGEYHIPTRFANDALERQIDQSAVIGGDNTNSRPIYSFPQIELIEVKNW